MLGKVIRHKALGNELENDDDHFTEAIHLHRALEALQISLEHNLDCNKDPGSTSSQAILNVVSICISARFILYNRYACNDLSAPVSGSASCLRTELQSTCLEGIKDLAFVKAPKLAQLENKTPFSAQTLYHAASECAWFIREDRETEMFLALQTLVNGLESIRVRWNNAGMYIHL